MEETVKELTDALKDAIELCTECLCYVDSYYLDKWGLNKDLETLKQILSKYTKK